MHANVILACLTNLAITVAASPYSIPESRNSHEPQVTVKNGTFQGLYLPSFDEDIFLGIPFANPPLNNLRLRHPVSYNESWSGIRNATVHSPSCPGYTDFEIGLTLGEDCLTVDIVRPAGTDSTDKLPVFVWIYGGGVLCS